LKLPPAIYQLDCDPEAFNRSYPMRDFVLGDTKLALAGLIRRLKGRLKLDPALQKDAAAARAQAEKTVRAAWKPYDGVSDALQKVVGRDFNWVRDVTIANATWGNRLFQLFDTGQGVHASGGGIGQGLAMGVGAAVGAPQRKTWVLSGDGGFMLNMGELATAVQEKTGLVLLMMNDGGYGILRNLQDADFEGRRYYADLHGPNFEWLAKSLGTGFHKVTRLDGLEGILRAAKDDAAPTTIVEFDLRAIGPSARPFTGPPLGRG
jgi:acetolactate synthase-1/2/3 large subunit